MADILIAAVIFAACIPRHGYKGLTILVLDHCDIADLKAFIKHHRCKCTDVSLSFF